MLMGPPGVQEKHFHLQCTLRLPPSSLNISAHCTWLLRQLGHWHLTPQKLSLSYSATVWIPLLEWQVFFSFGKCFWGTKNCLLILMPRNINPFLSSPSPPQRKQRGNLLFFMDASNKLLQEEELSDSVSCFYIWYLCYDMTMTLICQ